MKEAGRLHPNMYRHPAFFIYTLDAILYDLAFVAVNKNDKPVAFVLLDDIKDKLIANYLPNKSLKLANTAVISSYQGRHLEYRLACYALTHYKHLNNFEYVWCSIHPYNIASIKSLTAAGFKLLYKDMNCGYGLRNIYIQKL